MYDADHIKMLWPLYAGMSLLACNFVLWLYERSVCLLHKLSSPEAVHRLHYQVLKTPVLECVRATSMDLLIYP